MSYSLGNNLVINYTNQIRHPVSEIFLKQKNVAIQFFCSMNDLDIIDQKSAKTKNFHKVQNVRQF